MNQEQYFDEFNKMTMDMCKTTQAKNTDYAKSENAFANFENSAAVAGVSVERGILIRMADKMSRIGNLISKEAQVKEESIDDTLKDLAVYATILRIYRRYKINQIKRREEILNRK